MTPIVGLEPLYGPQPWDPHQYGLAPDPMGGAAGYAYHPAFEGAMEVQAAEALYREVREVARRCAVEGRPCYVVETGTCDGYSTAFIARALCDTGWPVANALEAVKLAQRTGHGALSLGHVWTCEFQMTRGDGTKRPWPELWHRLGLANVITVCEGDSRVEATWHGLPSEIDVLFLDSDHATAQVMAEFELLGPRLRRGGVLMLHDVCLPPHLSGVGVAVDRICDAWGVEGPEMLDSCRGLAKIVKPVSG